MRKIADAFISVVAVVAVAMIVSAPAAVASDTPLLTQRQVSEPSSVSPAAAPAQQATSRTRQMRRAPVRLARVASLARPGCGWFVSSCDRDFVLILGIGF